MSHDRRPYVCIFFSEICIRIYQWTTLYFFIANAQIIFIAYAYTYKIHENQKYMKVYFKNIQTIRVIVMNVNSGTDKERGVLEAELHGGLYF